MTRGVFLFQSAFLASGVEMVEALTIVLAAIVAVLGPAVSAVPLTVLRLIVGGLLLIFGLQWLRKATFRAGGYKTLHDEAATYEKEREQAQHAAVEARRSVDWYSFTVSLKGVFLEGLEVAFIVVTFGAAQPNAGGLMLASLGTFWASADPSGAPA
jgi:uncharacterized membrane protein